jgi:hypothetical protein
VFEQIVAELAATGTDGQTHAQMEECPARAGRKLSWQLLQDHLDLLDRRRASG